MLSKMALNVSREIWNLIVERPPFGRLPGRRDLPSLLELDPARLLDIFSFICL